MAGYCSPPENLALLEQLLGARQEMAALVGARSYAHHNLRDATLAGSPEAVHSFLLDLAAAIQPKVRSPSVWGAQRILLKDRQFSCTVSHAVHLSRVSC